MSDLLFEYKVRARHRLGWKEFTFYATTDIEEFLNRNSIDYVRNVTDTAEHRQLKEIERLNNIINELEKDIKNLYTYGIKNNAEQRNYLLNRLEELKEYKGSDKK